MDSPHSPASTPLARALDTVRRLKAQLDALRADPPIAVVGVGLRFPGGIDSLDAYWQALADGRDLVRPMPAARKARFAAAWDALPHRGGFLDDVTGFDAAFFGISPREARALDPQHRVLLEVAWEALEGAALPPDRLAGTRTGLYVGITGQDYRDWQGDEHDVYWATGNGHSFAAGRLAYALGATGPAVAIDTACSSGLVAVHLACQAVRRGECSVAVAGGVNLILSPRSTRAVLATRALSPDGLCKAFDARADGFTRSEGCGAVVLKRLDHAVRDGDHVHAVIRGSAINQDGRSSGFTAPNVRSQIGLIEAALADAGLGPADIGLVEAHGTGTALGDPIEMAALVEALGRPSGGATLYVGSVKANLGHTEAAAGIAGLLKAIACCAHRAVPALVHHRTLNPRIDLAGTGITLPTALVPWSGGAGRFAGVSAFGLSGTNAHVIVGPADPAEPRPPQPAHGFELSARTPEALRLLASRFRDRLAELSDDDYPAFAYTATFGRARHGVRARVAAADRTAALAGLAALAGAAPSPAVTLDATGSLDELPRRVVALPHYPWQRERHAPDAPAAVAAPPPPVTRPVALPGQAAPATARSEVRRCVAAVLGEPDATAIADDAVLFDLGLDSLMAADLARDLGAAFGVELAMTHVFDHPTVTGLAGAVLALLPDTAIAAADSPRSAAAIARARLSPGVRPPRIAFVFSCQGSQHFGMGRELYDTEPVFRSRIDACDRILAPHLGASLRDLMLSGADREAIHQTRVTQPALVALELALAELWRSRGVTAAAVLGHSLGEIAAAIHAGVIDLEPGLALVAQRGRLMQLTAGGMMLAIQAPAAQVACWLDGTGVDVAAFNGPESIVVSGARAAVETLADQLRARGVTVRPLVVSHASHSRMMDPVVGAFHRAIADLTCHPPRIPIIASLTGQLAAPGMHDARYWARHLREPVRFHDGARALRALDIDVCLEIGPDRTLINLLAASGELPPGGGIASLQRGTSSRTSLLAAAEALRAQGTPITDLATDPPRATPRPSRIDDARRPTA